MRADSAGVANTTLYVGSMIAGGTVAGDASGYVMTGNARGLRAGARAGAISGGLFAGADVLSQDWGQFGRIGARVTAGGMSADIQGGSFADGARAEGFLQMFSGAADFYKSNVGGTPSLRPGENRPSVDSIDPGTGQQLPQDRSRNVLGLKRQIGSDPGFKGFLLDTITEQGPISRALNVIPGLNSGLARVHDYWFNDSTGYNFNVLSNVGTFIPAATVGYGAIIGNYTQGWQNNPTASYYISQSGL